VFLFFWCTLCSLNHPPGERLVVLSHTSLCSIHVLTLQNVMNTGFTDASLMRALPYRLPGNCMKACSTVPMLPSSVELRGLQSTLYLHVAVFHQPQTYHATVTRVGGGV
jgi:hypothetical protein